MRIEEDELMDVRRRGKTVAAMSAFKLLRLMAKVATVEMGLLQPSQQ